MKTMQPRRASSLESCEGANSKIKDLEAGMKRINLKARVLAIPKSKMVYTRWGDITYVSNALIADETGSIRISLWNQQINIVSEATKLTPKMAK